jgi:tRNA (guanine-N7-)-methyltransferase
MGDEPARGAARRKVHGRRRGKALKPSQRRHLATLLPRLLVPGVAPDGAPERRAVDLAALFPGAREVWLEIGFGGGSTCTASRARTRMSG